MSLEAEQARRKTEKAWRALVDKYRGWKPGPQRPSAECLCPSLFTRYDPSEFPREWMPRFDIRAYRVQITWPIHVEPDAPSEWRKWSRLSRHLKRRMFIEGEEYAIASELHALAPSKRAFEGFVYMHQEIRRWHAHPTLVYYNVADFTHARSQRYKHVSHNRRETLTNEVVSTNVNTPHNK